MFWRSSEGGKARIWRAGLRLRLLCLYRCQGLCLVLHAARSISFVRFGAGGGNANSGCMYGVIAMSAHVQLASWYSLYSSLFGLWMLQMADASAKSWSGRCITYDEVDRRLLVLIGHLGESKILDVRHVIRSFVHLHQYSQDSF
ncbi:hypothetical protein CC77DRAFT_152750 [Alternaria alternata]|uniref:Uncharacterized protein n=1 Tax=Alternaria alternata TaxID=5599 RepID=A0A177DHL7_ALTAL|nr:hypothetical protein CC77DRAFT_152750 [Alternaria alternata]OAG19233.1 hypothetical protein CC77DRAFT_152750 [Alternaria alternata]